MDENWPDCSTFRHIILTWYKEPYKTKKMEKKMISLNGLKNAYSQFPSSVGRRKTYLTILKRAWSADSKMVRYVLL
jgi:hypothetical protein